MMSEDKISMIMRGPSLAIMVIMMLVRVCLGVAQSDTAFDSSRQTPVVLVNTNHATIPRRDSTNCAIAISQRTLDFGYVPVGSLRELTFTVQIAGTGLLSGTAKVSAPFNVLAGSSYALKFPQSQTITVQYAPQSTGMHMAVVHLTGGGGATVTVMGSGAPRRPPDGSRPLKVFLAGR